MANLFGFNITRSRPKLATAGTQFEARSLLHEVALAHVQDGLASEEIIKAGMGTTRKNGSMLADLPPIRDTIVRGNRDLSQRTILNDPRELYWGFLPNKLQPKQVEQMLRAALGGDLWQQWRLYSQMIDTWPKFAMALHQLREAVSYCKFSVEAYRDGNAEPTEKAIAKRDLVARAMANMSPNPFNDEKNFSGMVYNFTDGIANGIAMTEILWKEPERMTGGKWQRLPKAAAWIHPRHYTFDQSGQVVVWGTDYSLMYNDPRLIGGRIGVSPEREKFICSQFMSRSGSALACGFMRQIAWWWTARQYGLDFALRMAQNFGNPFVNFTYKPGMSAQERVDMAKEIAKGFGNRVLGHPEGTTLEIAEAQNLSTENPQRWLIEESDREVLYILLGQTGSTISTQGKLGGEETHNSVKQERVAGAAEWVAQTSLDQFARSVLLVNYEEDSECPAIKPDFTKALNALEVGTLCTALTSSKMPFKAEEVFQKTGFTQPEKGDVVIQNGEIKIQGDALTPEEKQKQELDLQKKQMQLAGQNKPAVQAKAVADYLEQSFQGMDSRLVLAKATDEEIDELEKMVTAAELAPHQNGEYHALTAKITQLSNRRN